MNEPSFPYSLNNSIYVNPLQFQNMIPYATYADLPDADEATIYRIYRVVDTGISYIWDGSAYQVYNQPGGGRVDSISAGSNIAITGTADVPIVSVVASPAFTSATLTTPLGVASGGSGVGTLTLNRFLVGNGTSGVLTTKTVPTGDVIGTTDNQALTNKSISDVSNDVFAKALHTNSAYVEVATSAQPPSAGYVLTTINGTQATWQLPSGSSPTLLLTGAVVVDNAGVIYLNGVPQVASYYSLSGSVLSILCDVIIDGSLTLNSGASLIVEADITVMGSVAFSTTSSFASRGCCHFRAKTGADTCVLASCSIVSFSEFSVRNYGTTVTMTSAGTALSIQARSIVFDSNARVICAAGGVGFTMNADTVVFSNNSYTINDGSFCLHFYTLTINSIATRVTSNNCTNSYCVVFQASDIVTTNTFDVIGNSSGVNSGATVYFQANTSIRADKATFSGNYNLGTAGTGQHAIQVQNDASIISNTIEFIGNYTKSSGSYGIIFQATNALCKCEMLQIDMSIGGSGGNYSSSAILTAGNLQSQYSTGRLPQCLLYNPTNQIVVNFPVSSSLGLIPFYSKNFSDYATPLTVTMTTATVLYIVSPTTTDINGSASISGNQFQQGATSGSIQYIGEDATNLMIDLTITLRVSNAADTYYFELRKNGNTNNMMYGQKFGTNNRFQTITFTGVVSAVKNDTFALYIQDGDANNRTADFAAYDFSIRKLTIM